MDFMTVRHSTNDVLDGAVDNRQHVEQDRRAIRALKQGLGNSPSDGGVFREESLLLSSGGRFSAEMMDLMTVRHSNIDVLDDAEENRKQCVKKEASGQGPQTGPRDPSL